VYSLSLGDAKDVFVRAEGLAESRDEFQGMIADCLEREAVGTRYERLGK
jgi:hypothetical protein